MRRIGTFHVKVGENGGIVINPEELNEKEKARLNALKEHERCKVVLFGV